MRALILSDIHGNLEALEAVLAAAGEFDQLWNLGDMVGYGASPNQILDRIRTLATTSVRGNHDRVCAGLTSALNFNPVARAAAMWTYNELTPDNLAWLRAVPQGPLQPEHIGVGLAHGSPLDEDHYILTLRDAWAPLQQMTNDLTFFGHTHVQGGFAQRDHEWQEFHPHYVTRNEPNSWALPLLPGLRYLINPGSVGQPRDSDWRAAYALYDSGSHTVAPEVIFHRIPYDVATAQGRILMAGLPERLASRLREGR